MNQDEFYRMVDAAEGRTAVAFPPLMRKVYTWMALALVITGITAMGVVSSPNLLSLIFTNQVVFWGMIISELLLVITLSARLERLSLATATLLFILYSVLNGATLSCVFLVYTLPSIAKTFFICAGTFGAMALYGLKTKRDLSSMGTFLTMALIGLIIATVVNIFVRSTGFDLILGYVGVLIFVGLTAWHTQKIRNWLVDADMMDESAHKLALIGAFSLYLDFINLFLHLLRIFGRRD